MVSRGLPAIVLAIAVGVGTVLPPARAALPASLPQVTDGARPGPDVLYANAPPAPQLENRHPRFRAAMLRVAATEAYVDGEYLHTDYLYDDYGADTDGRRGGSLSERSGDINYPDDEDYAGNAADIVEVRIAPGTDDVLYRITLNSLLRKDTTMVALAFDTDRDSATGVATLPRDPGAPFPGTDEVITVWGSGGEHSRLAAGDPAVTTDVDVAVDLDANQITVTVPRSVSDPRGVWRATVAAGLHDPDTGGWLDTGGPNDIFNLAFRYDEPVQMTNTPPDVNQSIALSDDAPTRYARDIDFGALDAGQNTTTVPATGRQIRMFPSRLRLGEGRNLDQFPEYRGQLQPYAVYLPAGYRPGRRLGLTLSLHSLGQQYWQYQGGKVFEQLGEERDDIVVSPMGRGPDGWYQREAEFDVFEVWNDVARQFSLDPDRAYIWGYSMGGYGTYRLGGLYPDLFASALTVVGPPGDGIWVPPAPPTGGAPTLSNLWLENVRNIPYMNLAAAEDELVPVVGPRAQNLGAPEQGIRGFEQLGYRYRFLLFPAAEHFTLALLGYDLPRGRDHLGNAPVDRNPPHVTFAYLPGSDAPGLGLVHDHAYWVSDVRLADAESETAKGVVDARSRAFGVVDPLSEGTQDAGVMQLPYVETGRAWLPAEKAPAENALELQLQNIRTASINLRRARLDPASRFTVESVADTAAALVLDAAFPSDVTVTEDGEAIRAVRGGEGRLTLPVREGEHTYVIAPADRRGGENGGGSGTSPDDADVGGEADGRGDTDVSLPATGAAAALPLLGLVLAFAGARLRRRR